MIFAIFFLVVGLIATCVVICIVVRRWQDIGLLDPSSIKDEQERVRREALIMRRFERMRSERTQPFKHLSRQLGRAIQHAQERLQNHVRSVDKLYQNAKQPFAAMAPSTRERIKTLLNEGRSFVRDLKWTEAERRYLEILTLDTRNADAYRGLGGMYIKQKSYPQAKETFEFLLKIKKADDATYMGLAEIAEEEGKIEEAKSFRLKAVEASPRQGCRHAELAEFFLRQGDAKKAHEAALRAVKLEPSSAKYLELSLEAAILLPDRKEAERLYDQLRFATSDSSRFRRWKDKIEKMPT